MQLSAKQHLKLGLNNIPPIKLKGAANIIAFWRESKDWQTRNKVSPAEAVNLILLKGIREQLAREITTNWEIFQQSLNECGKEAWTMFWHIILTKYLKPPVVERLKLEFHTLKIRGIPEQQTYGI